MLGPWRLLWTFLLHHNAFRVRRPVICFTHEQCQHAGFLFLEGARRGGWLRVCTGAHGLENGLGTDGVLGLLESAHKRLDRVLCVALLIAMALPQAPSYPVLSEAQALRHLITYLDGTVLWHLRSHGQSLRGVDHRFRALAQ